MAGRGWVGAAIAAQHPTRTRATHSTTCARTRCRARTGCHARAHMLSPCSRCPGSPSEPCSPPRSSRWRGTQTWACVWVCGVHGGGDVCVGVRGGSKVEGQVDPRPPTRPPTHRPNPPPTPTHPPPSLTCTWESRSSCRHTPRTRWGGWPAQSMWTSPLLLLLLLQGVCAWMWCGCVGVRGG